MLMKCTRFWLANVKIGGKVRRVNFITMSKVTEKDQTLSEDMGPHDESAAEMELPATDAESAIALLQSWCSEDAQEQRETWEFLKTALDQDRLSDRKLFS
jgi:hypothetical protein